MNEWLAALILGLVEGITEFIPVSSTGHLILAQHLLGLPDAFWGTFIVMIQLGAILSVVVLYFARLWQAVITLPSDPASRRFALSVIVAFLPAMVLGVLLHDVIKRVLFASPAVICWSLIIGGVALTLATHGTDQFLVQRLLAARSAREASRGLVLSGFIVFAQFIVFLLIGLLLLWLMFFRRRG